MFHPPPTYSLRASASLTYFCILLRLCCFSHLIGLLSVTWLSLLYKFNRFFYLFFCFSLTKGQWRAKTLDYTICIGSTPTFLYFDLYLYSAYATHYLYEENGVYCIVLYSNCYLFACVPTGTCLCQCTVCVSLVFRHMYNF